MFTLRFSVCVCVHCVCIVCALCVHVGYGGRTRLVTCRTTNVLCQRDYCTRLSVQNEQCWTHADAVGEVRSERTVVAGTH